MKEIVGLAVALALTLTCVAQDIPVDSHVRARATEYFQSLQSGDFNRLWEMSSDWIREDGGDRDTFVAHAREMAPYDLKVDLLDAPAFALYGEGYVIHIRVQTLARRGATWKSKIFESRWIQQEDGEWYLDDIEEDRDWKGAEPLSSTTLPN